MKVKMREYSARRYSYDQIFSLQNDCHFFPLPSPCDGDANDVEPSAIPVTVEPVSTRNIAQKIEEVGKITALDNANLTFQCRSKD